MPFTTTVPVHPAVTNSSTMAPYHFIKSTTIYNSRSLIHSSAINNFRQFQITMAVHHNKQHFTTMPSRASIATRSSAVAAANHQRARAHLHRSSADADDPIAQSPVLCNHSATSAAHSSREATVSFTRPHHCMPRRRASASISAPQPPLSLPSPLTSSAASPELHREASNGGLER